MLAIGTGFEGLLASEWVIFGFYLVAVGFSIYSAVRGPSDQEVETTGPRVEDNKLTVSTLGTPKPICYGTVRLGGNIIWVADLEEEIITEEIEQGGGKGGGGGITTSTTSYLYFRSLAIAFGEGGANCRILKLFANGKLVWDTEGTSNIESIGVNLKWYRGTDTQDPDPLIEADVGSANCPAYRGTCYAVLNRFPLANFGNAIPNFTAVIAFNFAGTYPVTDLVGNIRWEHGYYDEAAQAIYYTGPITYTNNHWLARYDIATETQTKKVDLHGSGGYYIAGPPAVLPLSGLIFVPASTDATLHDPISLEEVADATHSSTQAGNANGLGLYTDYAGNADYVLIPGLTRIVAYRIKMSGEVPVLTNFGDIYCQYLGLPVGVTYWSATRAMDAAADRDGTMWVVGYFARGVAADREPVIWQFDRMATEYIEVARFDITHPSLPPTDNIYLYSVGYDAATHSLLVGGSRGGSNFLFRWDIETREFVWLRLGAEFDFGDSHGTRASRMGFKHPVGNSYWLALPSANTQLREFDFTTGAMLNEYELEDWFPIVTSFGVYFYHGTSHSLIGSEYLGSGNFEMHRAWLDRGTGNTVGLNTVVSDICVRAGLGTGDINVTDLSTEVVRGYRITRRTSARAAIETLTKGYFFDAVESDFVLKFLLRGGSRDTGETIPEDDLGAGIDAPGGYFVEEERIQDEEIPVQFDIRFINPSIDYQEDSALAQRILSPIMHATSQSEQAASLPIVFTANEARRIAERWLFTAWTERMGLKFTMLPKWMRADPTDIFTVIAGSVSRKVRMLGLRVGESFDLEADAVVVDQDSYVSSDSEGAEIDFTPQEIGLVTGSYMLALDIPLLRDGDDGGGLTVPTYVSVRSRAETGWAGGVALKSYDRSSWTQLGAFTSDSAYGWATEALGDWHAHTTDVTNTVQIQLAHEGLSLSSITETELLRGHNPAMLGTELIQFQNATDLGDGVWELDTFLRGRRGTEWATGNHSAGERFVFLSVGTTRLHKAPLGDLNLVRYYRGVNLGASLTSGHMVSLATTGVSLKPLSPSYVGGVRDSGASKLHIYWTRRSRLSGDTEWTQRYDSGIPVGEATEAYEVDLLHKTTGEVYETYGASHPVVRKWEDSRVEFTIPSVGLMRIYPGGSDFWPDYTPGRLLRVIGAYRMENNGTFLMKDYYGSYRMDVYNADCVPTNLNPGTRKIFDQIVEQVAIPNGDLTSAGYSGITDDVDVVVYQLSAVVGRGYGTSATV